MNGLKVAITLLAAAQAMIAALLGFAEILPQWAKVGLVVLAAGIAVVLNQMPSWQDSARAERALDKAGV